MQATTTVHPDRECGVFDDVRSPHLQHVGSGRMVVTCGVVDSIFRTAAGVPNVSSSMVSAVT